MTTKLQKWGNSSGIRIPKQMLTNLNFKEGTVLSLTETPEGILIKSAKPRYYFDIKDLVKGMNKKNRHELIDWGKPVGEEVW